MNDETLNVVRVIKQREKDAGSGKNRRRQNRDRRREGSEFEQQHEENQHQRQQQNDHEIAERFLLFLVGAAVLDANRRRQLQVGDGFLHGRDAGAQVHAFQARRHFHIALQIVAKNLGLAGQFR